MIYSSYRNCNSINHSDQCLSKDVQNTATFCRFKKSIWFCKLSSHDGFIIKYFRYFILVLNWFFIFFFFCHLIPIIIAYICEHVSLSSSIYLDPHEMVSKTNITCRFPNIEWIDSVKWSIPIPFWFSISGKKSCQLFENMQYEIRMNLICVFQPLIWYMLSENLRHSQTHTVCIHLDNK